MSKLRNSFVILRSILLLLLFTLHCSAQDTKKPTGEETVAWLNAHRSRWTQEMEWNGKGVVRAVKEIEYYDSIHKLMIRVSHKITHPSGFESEYNDSVEIYLSKISRTVYRSFSKEGWEKGLEPGVRSGHSVSLVCENEKDCISLRSNIPAFSFPCEKDDEWTDRLRNALQHLISLHPLKKEESIF